MHPLITFPLFAAPDAKKAISKQTYNYDIHNGKLKGITYGNGLVEEYVYNELDMISEIWYTNNGTTSKAYSYYYTADGNVAVYFYDEKGSPIGFKDRASSYSSGIWDAY